MNRTIHISAGLAFLLLVGLAPCPAGAEPIMPLSEVRPGMTGHGLTVFRGTTPERFDVEVIDVLHGFRPRQDLILIRMRHPLLDQSGTVGGMSGSPIYIDGRLIGALAYGWLYAMEPIAGVTPIEAMLGELDRPLRPPPLAGGPVPPRVAGRRSRPSAQTGPLAAPPSTEYWRSFQDTEGPVPAMTPLLLGGFSARVRQTLRGLLEDFALVPLEAGGGGRREAGETGEEAPRFVPGGPLGVQLVRGDVSATAIGTVTTLRGDRVLAFGHPMFGNGQQHFPVVTARILHVLASRRRSFKIGEPQDEAGALIQDLQTCIIADTTRRGPMTAFDVRALDRTTGRRDRFQYEVVRDPHILPILGLSALMSVLHRFVSDRTDMTFSVRGTLHPVGRDPITLEDHAVTDEGMDDRSALLRMRPFSALRSLLNNDFEPVAFDRVEIELSYQFRRDEAEILGAYVTTEEPEPGRSLPVHIVLRPFNGPEEVRVIRVDLPENLTPGETIRIDVEGGSDAEPPAPEPQSLDDVVANLHRTFPATSLVVTVQQPAPGVSIRGHVAENLPPSAVDALRPVAIDIDEHQFHTVVQQSTPTNWVITSNATLRLDAGHPRR